jgi:hypothetical protein
VSRSVGKENSGIYNTDGYFTVFGILFKVLTEDISRKFSEGMGSGTENVI